MSSPPNFDPAAVKRAVEREMNALATDVLAEAKRQVPLDKGMLRRSGTKEIGWQGDRIVATVSFNTVYAAVQHEGTNFRHPRGGKAKYLEDPLKQYAPEMRRRLNRAYRAALG